MYRYLPNALTLIRLILAAGFFLVLNLYRYPVGPDWALAGACLLFLAAAVTDALDGYLARRWHVESTFGRIMDPFCDKVLILGAFIYLAGPRFVIPHKAYEHAFFNMISGVYPWMVALMLARELLVTAVRGEIETHQTPFPARLSGKLKMILQSLVVPAVLVIVWLNPLRPHYAWLAWLRDILIYATVLVTFVSGLPYVAEATHLLRKERLSASDRDQTKSPT